MRQKFELTMMLIGFLVAAVIPQSFAAGQGGSPPSLGEQLQAQYQLTQMGVDANGPSITQPGTVLAIQKGGILGVAPTTLVICPAKYQDSTLHAPSALCVAMVKQTSRSFQIGEKVYATKIEVKPKNDRVSVRIVACDSCNGTNPPTFYKSQVEFQFGKGSLETPDVSKIEETIGEVLAIDSSVSQAPPAAPPEAQPEPPAAAQPAPMQAPPTSIQLGQTIDQVVAALGQPEKLADLGSKKIYTYKDLKVTFLNGKVADAE